MSPTFGEDNPHLQVAGGQPDDGRFVQLRGDGGRQRQQLGQLVELAVLLLPPGPRRVLRLLLHGGACRCLIASGRRRLRARDRRSGLSLRSSAGSVPALLRAFGPSGDSALTRTPHAARRV